MNLATLGAGSAKSRTDTILLHVGFDEDNRDAMPLDERHGEEKRRLIPRSMCRRTKA